MGSFHNCKDLRCYNFNKTVIKSHWHYSGTCQVCSSYHLEKIGRDMMRVIFVPIERILQAQNSMARAEIYFFK